MPSGVYIINCTGCNMIVNVRRPFGRKPKTVLHIATLLCDFIHTLFTYLHLSWSNYWLSAYRAILREL